MIVCVSAGHALYGAVGASGCFSESNSNRYVKDYLIEILEENGCTCFDCTIDNCNSSNTLLRNVVSKHNSHKRDLDIQIHFNAGVNDLSGDGKTTGTEALIWNTSDKNSLAYKVANRIVNNISKRGFKNRGVKQRQDLYFINSTSAQAVLIECCFCDDKDDYELYYPSYMAYDIACAIMNNNDLKWSRFDINQNNTNTNDTNKTKYVKVIYKGSDGLNVRNVADWNAKPSQVVHYGEVFTVVDTVKAKNGNTTMYKLKSGTFITTSDKYVSVYYK